MLWSFKGTDARRQQQDKRIGYDAPELWPWAGSPETRSFDLHRFNPAYFERLKQLVADAESRRMVVLVTVHDGWTKTSFDGHPFNCALGNGPLSSASNMSNWPMTGTKCRRSSVAPGLAAAEPVFPGAL